MPKAAIDLDKNTKGAYTKKAMPLQTHFFRVAGSFDIKKRNRFDI
jgi:hypothetical protein